MFLLGSHPGWELQFLHTDTVNDAVHIWQHVKLRSSKAQEVMHICNKKELQMLVYYKGRRKML